MTVNALVIALNCLIAVGLVALGLGLLWQSRHRWREWPSSAGVAIAGPYLLPGIVIAQLAWFRVEDAEPDWIGPNGYGTLALRLACAMVVVALAWRVYGGRLLTERDREGRPA